MSLETRPSGDGSTHPAHRPGDREAGAAQGLMLALAGFFPVMAIVSLAPAVPTLLAHFASVPHATTLVPLIVTAPGLMIALLSPVAGWAADRFGRRPLLLGATLFYGVFGTLPAFLSGLDHVLVTRFALGIAEAAILTLTNVLIADYFAPSGRRTWLTVQSILGPILGVATITSSGLLTAMRWNGAFLIYLVALPMFALMIPTMFEPRREAQPAGPAEPAGHAEPAAAERFPWRIAMGFVPLTLFAAILYYVFIVEGGLAFAEVGLSDPGKLGGLLALASLAVPAGGLLFGYLSPRRPILQVLAIMFAMLGIGMVAIGLAASVPAMVAASAVQQLGAGMCVASLIYWVSGLLPESQRGRGFGLWTSAFFLGQFVSPTLAGPLALLLGTTQRMFLAAGIAGSLFGLALFAATLRRSSPAVPESRQEA